MSVFKAVAIGLVLLASQTYADICTGRQNGEHFPNLEDCSSFYVCNFGVSKLFECPGGLLYDHSKRSCNWAGAVDCDRNNEYEESSTIEPITEASTISPVTEGPTPQTPQTVETTILPPSPSGKPDFTNGPVHPTIKPEFTTKTPEIIVTPSHPVYNETDIVYPGLIEISPNIFHCMDPEFYFAPHPRNCEMYFICENYRIHPHECGEGVHWDYMNNRCDYPIAAICYGTTSNNVGKMVCSSGGYTFEYKQNECKYVAEPSPVQPGNDITCPDTQAFIPHEEDCRKYYICIERMPIATSCPENTAWDKNLHQCNEESWKQCVG